MKKITKLFAVILCVACLLVLASCKNDIVENKCEHEAGNGIINITEWGKNMNYTCSKCNENITEATNGMLTLNAVSKDGATFIGWQIGDTVYAAGQTVAVYGGEAVTPVFDNSDNHVCAYTKDASSVEPTCTVIGQYKLTCSCGEKSIKKTLPALGHAWTEWASVEGTEYSTRKCDTCGITEEKKLIADGEIKTIFAIGDSITYGKKVDGNNGSYAKFVAEGLGAATYVNKAVSGSEAYQWLSLITGTFKVKGVVVKEIKNDAKVTKSEAIQNIEAADAIIFTIGTNDIFYTQYRTVKDIHKAIINLIDEIHKVNPNAKIIMAGGAYSPKFWDGAEYEKDQERLAELTEKLVASLADEKYKDFAFFVDTTTVLSDVNAYKDVSYGNPDNIHPGFEANKTLAELILKAIKK